MLYNYYPDTYGWYSYGTERTMMRRTTMSEGLTWSPTWVDGNTTLTVQSDLHCCPWCGLWHTGTCPRVKAIEYYPDGSIKRVEFHGEGAPVELAYVCDEWREVKDDYPPLFYERVIDEVVKKLTDYSRLAALADQ